MVQPIPQQSWVIDGTMIVEEYLARKVSEGTTPPMHQSAVCADDALFIAL